MPSSITDELNKIKLEKEALELELMKAQVESLKSKQNQKLLALKANQEALEMERRDNQRKQSLCTHRKGGVDLPGLSQGFDAKYSVFKHVLPTGELYVICSRCGKEWRPGMPDYEEAINFPTDNKTSQSSQFRIT